MEATSSGHHARTEQDFSRIIIYGPPMTGKHKLKAIGLKAIGRLLTPHSVHHL
jgi:hypothetical protein